MYDWAEVSLDPTPENWGNETRALPFAHGTPRGVLDDTVVLPLNRPEEAERALRGAGTSLAAVLVDPVPAMAGMVPATFGYLQTLQRVARELGAMLIVDEVIAFRLAYRGAQARFFLEPDLTVFGKIIGGGFPVGAVGGTNRAMAVFSHEQGKPLAPSSGTFTGNPVTMRAGLATMELLTAAAYDRLEALGEHARQVARRAIAAAGRPWQVTGIGSMLQLHPHPRPIMDYRSAYPGPAESAEIKRVHGALLERGFIVSPRLALFLSTANTADQLDRFAGALAEVLGAA
jgi:glutamate-1-semialdehyde 2,1-aminomutase